MFTLGAITCPRCSSTLHPLTFTAEPDGMQAEAQLRCAGCRCQFTLLATLLDLLPVSAPSSRVEKQEAPLVPVPDGAALTGLEDLAHVDVTAHPIYRAADHLTDDGFYACPLCPQILDTHQSFTGHVKTHEVPAPCPHGCGRLLKSSGVARHVAAGCPALTTTTQEEPCPPPPPTDPTRPTGSAEARPAPTAAEAKSPPPTAAATPAPSATATSAPAAAAGPRASAPARSSVKAPPTRSAPTARPGRKARTVSETETAKAREKASARMTPKGSTTSGAAATTSTAETAPPLQARSGTRCGWSDEAGPCGRVKERGDTGWRRARTPSGWMDLCPDDADRDDDAVERLLSADSLTPVT